ncbi:ComF family protein [Candidatus Sumerlaeota bacterium]|nr:ComF family protein [Candidatus Sumerlaeota bacterium]
MLREIIAQVLDVAIPPCCLACYRALGPRIVDYSSHSLLCDDCAIMMRPTDLAKACAYCGVSPHYPPKHDPAAGRCSECEALPASFIQARSAFPYDSPAGAIVRNMKYQRAPFLAGHLVQYSTEVLDDWLKVVTKDAIIVAVPMGLWRQLRKTTNQAQELAGALAQHYGSALLGEGAFLRVESRSPQARFHSWQERAANVAGIFCVKRPGKVRDARIVLVDDVMTTGATVGAAASTLLEAGAREVFVYTPVRARMGEDDDDQSESVRLD